MSTRPRFNSYPDAIDAGFWRRLCREEGELRHYDRGEEFVTAGTVGRYIGCIETGAMKYVCYDSEGSPHVMGLETAGEFVCDFPFSIFGRKSRCSIIATTPCDVWCVASSLVAGRMPTDPVLREMVFYSTVGLFDMVYDRHIGLYTLSPEERLHQLMSTDPQLFMQYSLQDIASLLGITPTHLSRLRKKIT